MTSTGQRIGPAAVPRRRIGTGGTPCRSGSTTCGPRSSCGNRSAESAPGGRLRKVCRICTGFGQPMLTTSVRIVACGLCSRIGIISSPCATLATAAKPWPKWPQIETVFGRDPSPARTRLRGYGRAGARRSYAPTPPPP